MEVVKTNNEGGEMIGSKVLVTTSQRGVFYGELCSKEGTTVILKQARNCLYWDRSVKGFLGLAKFGPISDSRVGPSCDETELFCVTSISRCTDEAIARWESESWSG